MLSGRCVVLDLFISIHCPRVLAGSVFRGEFIVCFLRTEMSPGPDG